MNDKLPEVLRIILNNKNYETLSNEEKLHNIKMALTSLTDEYFCANYYYRQDLLQDIESLQKLKNNIVKNNSI